MLPEGVGIIKRSVSRNLRVARKPLRQRIFGFFTRLPVFRIGNIAVKSRGTVSYTHLDVYKRQSTIVPVLRLHSCEIYHPAKDLQCP